MRYGPMIDTAVLVLGYIAVFLPALGGLLWVMTRLADIPEHTSGQNFPAPLQRKAAVDC